MTTLPIRTARYLPSISTSTLRSHLQSPGIPIHFGNDITSSWTAFSRWQTDDGLQKLRTDVGEDRVVEVELGKKGRGYLDPETQRVSIGFGLFLDAFILDRIPSSSPDIPSAYLAQSDLLDTPHLQSLLPELDLYKSGAQGSLYRRSMWIGPGGSFTPFHRDPYHGIYSQILGRKTFHLLPPGASRLLELSTDPLQRNTSNIPLPISQYFSPRLTSTGSAEEEVSTSGQSIAHHQLSAPDDMPRDTFQRHQRSLWEAFELDGACMADLGPGESILIPEGWFHSAEGADGPGVGVNAWFR